MHWLHAVDDRYICHYIGHSILRATQIFQNTTFIESENVHNKESDKPERFTYAQSGHYFFHNDSPTPYTSLITACKGGLVTTWSEKGNFSDFGWMLHYREKNWCTNWWCNDAEHKWTPEGLHTINKLIPYRDIAATPFKHIALRIVSFIFGNKIIGILKKHLIFREKLKSNIRFERLITFGPNFVEILDVFVGIPSKTNVVRALRFSKRHVASADSFHKEDIQSIECWQRTEQSERQKDILRITTRYTIKDK